MTMMVMVVVRRCNPPLLVGAHVKLLLSHLISAPAAAGRIVDGARSRSRRRSIFIRAMASRSCGGRLVEVVVMRDVPTEARLVADLLLLLPSAFRLAHGTAGADMSLVPLVDVGVLLKVTVARVASGRCGRLLLLLLVG